MNVTESLFLPSIAQHNQFRKNNSFSRLYTSLSTITATVQVTHTATRYIVIVDTNAQSNHNIRRCEAKANRLPLQYRVSIPNIYSNISTLPCSHTPLWNTSSVATSACQRWQKRDLHELTVTFCSRVDIVASLWNEHCRLTLCPVGEAPLKLAFVLKTKSKIIHKTRDLN